MKFQEITFDNRELWLEWRKGGIGSSDAAVIMDVSRFKSREELRNEKITGVKFEDQANSYVKDRGNYIEGFVRTALEDKHQTTYRTLNTINSSFGFMRASLDGISEDKKTIIEIKLLSVLNKDKPNYQAAGYLKWQAAREKNEIPVDYYPQIQHQLMVTGADRCYFVGYKEIKGEAPKPEGNLAIVEVLPDKNYIRELAKREFAFWYEVQERKQAVEGIS